MAFAASGPNTRATQLFVSTGDNVRKLDGQRLFMPFATVVEGLDVVEQLNAEYGEEPNFSRIVRQGNRYLERWFPALDSIVSATVVSDAR
jgi:cyclophilin family peptidyl-prolyl cis-trans isomerase